MDAGEVDLEVVDAVAGEKDECPVSGSCLHTATN